VARRNALGAVAAQFSQAIGSFLLHALAYRYGGKDGLGEFALLYGIVILATAVVTGLVGDPLTVLDRSEPTVRRGLQRWLASMALILSTVFCSGTWATGTLSGGAAIVFGATLAVFVVEDTVRRLMMSTLRFGGLVAIDLTSLVVSVGVVVVAHGTRDGAGTPTFLAGLLAGQVAACAVGWFVVAPQERWLARRVPPDLGAVWRYGSWRALQQMLRPGMMAVVRSAIVGAVGLTAYGTLESARVYVAPAMLTVAGAASYLFASYARDRTRPLGELLRRADRAVVLLLVLTSVAGAGAVLLTGPLGDALLDEGDSLSRLAVVGWAAYAAASAAVTPYGSLAAVRGRQRTVLLVRAAESSVSVGAVAVLLLADVDIMAIPLVLAAIAAASGAALRLPVLGRMPADG
jgi:O-antigen/teichoic acid export membrane protein